MRSEMSSEAMVPSKPWSAVQSGSPHWAGIMSSRLTAPHPRVSVRSRPCVPGVKVSGCATTWVSMTPRTAASGTVSVVAVAMSLSSDSAWSSAWAMTSRCGVTTRTVTWRRTVSWSKVVSWCTRCETTSSSAIADSTTSQTSEG